MKNKKFRFSHIGIPTTRKTDSERYVADYDLHITDHSENEFNVEWLRFGKNSTMPKIIQEVPHVAFEVDDIYEAIKGREVIIEPRKARDNLLIAFIVADGTPIEFLQFLDGKK